MRSALVETEPGNDIEGLYRRDGARLWRSLLGFTGDPELAKDAMAEAFAQAIGRGDAITHQDRWVWRAAFRIASGEMKQRARRRPLKDAARTRWLSRRRISCASCDNSLQGSGL